MEKTKREVSQKERKDAGGISEFYQEGRQRKSIGWWTQAETAGAPEKAGGRQVRRPPARPSKKKKRNASEYSSTVFYCEVAETARITPNPGRGTIRYLIGSKHPVERSLSLRDSTL